MNLYLLSSDEGALAACHQAAKGLALSLHEVSSVQPFLAASFDAKKSTLIAHCAYIIAHQEDARAAGSMAFMHRAIVCPDAASAEAVEAVASEAWEVITRPTAPSIRARLQDWMTVESLSQRSVAQENHARQSTAALERASQELTGLRHKVGLLDRQREKLSGVFETQTMLSKLSHEINCLDIEEIINTCVTKIPLLVDARYASFYLHNYRKNTLELKRHNHGFAIDDVVRVCDDSRSVMCRAVRERRIILVRDFDEYEKLHDMTVERPNARNYSSKSALIAPMLAGDRVVAVLNLADKRSGACFDESSDLLPIEQISVLVGSAIRNWQLYQEVQLQARTDAMTGFVNHQTFFEEIEKEVLRVRRYNGALSVLMLDVDSFKNLNDCQGHLGGDSVLGQVARIIRLNVRDSDVAARYGGDEFAVILGQADITRAKLVGERIRETIASQAFPYEERKLNVTVSIGVAQYRAGQSVTEFVADADKALYAAKARGRNRVEATPTA